MQGRDVYIHVERDWNNVSTSKLWLTSAQALSRWSYPDNVFYKTPTGKVDYQTLDRLSWISCLAKSWWYSEKLWSFQTPTVHNHQGRWTNLEPKTSHVSVPVTYSAPPVLRPARNTSWLDPTSRTVQTTFLLCNNHTRTSKRSFN